MGRILPHPMRRGKAFIGLFDQGVVSLTTVVLLMAAGQTLHLDEFGRYALGLAFAQPIVAVVRSITGESLIFRVVSASDDRGDSFIDDEIDSAFSLSTALGSIILVMGCVSGLLWNVFDGLLPIVGFAASAMVVQDCTRHVLMVRRDSTGLLLADGLLLGLSLIGTLVAGQFQSSAILILAVWGSAALFASVIVLKRTDISMSFRSALSWYRETGRASSAFLLEAVSGASTGYAIVIILSTSSGNAEVAAFKTCISVFGLTGVAMNYLRTVFLRDVEAELVRSVRGIVRILSNALTIIVLASGCTLLIVALLPKSFGVAMFGEVWAAVVPLGAMAAINRVGAGLSVVPLLVLRVQGVAWRATGLRILLMAGFFPITISLAFLFGARGAIVGDALLYFATGSALISLAFAGVQRSEEPGSA